MIVAWLELGAALIATALGQTAYKLYFHSKNRAYIAALVVFFLAAQVCTYLALGVLTIGTVYMSTAITQLLVVGLARLVLEEQLTADHGVAMVLIVLGVVIYAY